MFTVAYKLQFLATVLGTLFHPSQVYIPLRLYFSQGVTLAIILMAVKINQKMRWGPSAEKRQKKSNSCPDTQKITRKIQFQPRHTKKTKKSYFRTNFVLKKKKLWFSFPKGVPNYIFWRKWSCWGWREEFQWYFVCDDDAHKVVLCTRSHFFCTRWVLLRLKKTILKIHLTIKGKKLKYKNPPHEKMRKTQNNSAGSSKNDENHILGRNSDFQKKSGIFELEMSHPDKYMCWNKCW